MKFLGIVIQTILHEQTNRTEIITWHIVHK